MATRIYLPSSGAAPISPAYDGGWGGTGAAARVAAVHTTPSGSAMASVGYDGTANSTWQLIRQWVLGPIGAQTFASQTIEMQIRADDNGTGTRLLGLTIRVVSADGSTVRGTIVGSPVEDDTGTSSYRNRRITAVSASVDAEAGDYIVIEVGAHRSSGSSSNSGLEYEIRIGDAAAGDLPEDDTTTTDLNPWVEFPNDISFGGGGTTRRYSLTLTGVG